MTTSPLVSSATCSTNSTVLPEKTSSTPAPDTTCSRLLNGIVSVVKCIWRGIVIILRTIWRLLTCYYCRKLPNPTPTNPAPAATLNSNGRTKEIRTPAATTNNPVIVSAATINSNDRTEEIKTPAATTNNPVVPAATINSNDRTEEIRTPAAPADDPVITKVRQCLEKQLGADAVSVTQEREQTKIAFVGLSGFEALGMLRGEKLIPDGYLVNFLPSEGEKHALGIQSENSEPVVKAEASSNTVVAVASPPSLPTPSPRSAPLRATSGTTTTLQFAASTTPTTADTSLAPLSSPPSPKSQNPIETVLQFLKKKFPQKVTTLHENGRISVRGCESNYICLVIGKEKLLSEEYSVDAVPGIRYQVVISKKEANMMAATSSTTTTLTTPSNPTNPAKSEDPNITPTAVAFPTPASSSLSPRSTHINTSSATSSNPRVAPGNMTSKPSTKSKDLHITPPPRSTHVSTTSTAPSKPKSAPRYMASKPLTQSEDPNIESVLQSLRNTGFPVKIISLENGGVRIKVHGKNSEGVCEMIRRRGFLPKGYSASQVEKDVVIKKVRI